MSSEAHLPIIRALAQKFFDWTTPTELGPLKDIFRSYGGKELALLPDLERSFPITQGWADIRLALDHFYRIYNPRPTEECDLVIQTWHKANVTKPLETPTTGGVFTPLYAELDKQYNTNYFATRLQLLQLYDQSDSPTGAAAKKFSLTSLIDSTLSSGDLSFANTFPDPSPFITAAKKKVSDENDMWSNWLERFLSKHNPTSLGRIPETVVAVKGESARRQYEGELFRKYDGAKYLRGATWNVEMGDKGQPIRAALLEYLSVRQPDQAPFIDAILAKYPNQSDIFTILMRDDPAYSPIYTALSPEAQRTAHLPPWRNPDYPTDKLPPAEGTAVVTPFTEKTWEATNMAILEDSIYPPIQSKEEQEKEKAKEAEKEKEKIRLEKEQEEKRLEEEKKARLLEKEKEEEKIRLAEEKRAEEEKAARLLKEEQEKEKEKLRLANEAESLRLAEEKEKEAQRARLAEERSAEEALKAEEEEKEKARTLAAQPPPPPPPQQQTLPEVSTPQHVQPLDDVVHDQSIILDESVLGGSVQSQGSEQSAQRKRKPSVLQRIRSVLSTPKSASLSNVVVEHDGESVRSASQEPSPIGNATMPQLPQQGGEPRSPSVVSMVSSLASRRRAPPSFGSPTSSFMPDSPDLAHPQGIAVMSDPPRALVVQSPNLQGPAGVYYIAEDKWRDMPYWTQPEGEKCIYLDKREQWMIGKVSVMKDSRGWAMSRTKHNGRYPDAMDWRSKAKGWALDTSIVVTIVPEEELALEDEAQHKVILPTCERCLILKKELEEAQREIKRSWHHAQTDRDQVADMETRLRFTEHTAGKTVRREAEIPFLEDEKDFLEHKLTQERERADAMADQLKYLSNRELTRDDVGDELRSELLNRVTQKLDITTRQLQRMRDVVAEVALFDNSSNTGGLAALIGSLMTNIEADFVRAQDITPGGLDAAVATLRQELRAHTHDFGTPPRGALRGIREDRSEGERRAMLEERVAELQAEVTSVPLRLAELQAHVGGLQRAAAEREGVVAYLKGTSESQAQHVRQLQIQLEAAHAAMGLTPKRTASPPRGTPLSQSPRQQNYHTPPQGGRSAPPTLLPRGGQL